MRDTKWLALVAMPVATLAWPIFSRGGTAGSQLERRGEEYVMSRFEESLEKTHLETARDG